LCLMGGVLHVTLKGGNRVFLGEAL
jgi:hypothetical protein